MESDVYLFNFLTSNLLFGSKAPDNILHLFSVLQTKGFDDCQINCFEGTAERVSRKRLQVSFTVNQTMSP